jgi:diacylglycerol kinase (ATP)
VATLAIVNPVAGNGRAPRVWEQVRRDVDGLRAWECATTERAGHARELALSAARAGYERVVAIGGDGTACEVANGLATTETALASIPAGTGNDCVRNFGIPRDPRAAASLAVRGVPRRVDLGEIHTPQASAWFLNVAGFGFDAEVAWRANRMPRIVGGTAVYVLGVVQALRHYSSASMRLSLDGQLVDRQLFLVAVANGASYGGGMLIAPDARPDDGVFDVCLVDRLSRLEVLRMLPSLYSGGHRHHPAVEFIRCRELQAESAASVKCQADGELVGDLPATFSMRTGALRYVTGQVGCAT